MNRPYLISGETLKTVSQGALGAMTFGAYHQYTTNKIMELNNEKIEIQHRYFMDKLEAQHKKEMQEMEHKQLILNKKLDNIEKLVIERQSKWIWS
jgi:hypothetical protein